jgi:hypothetical protein
MKGAANEVLMFMIFPPGFCLLVDILFSEDVA